MHIVVLMAGRGQRFIDGGYTIPKPLIYYHNQTILEHTTRSCPFIQHNVRQQENRISFACLKAHKSDAVEAYLRDTYGDAPGVSPVWFDEITRGNLETAYVTVTQRTKPWEMGSELLILDSDNKYDHNGFVEFIEKVRRTPHSMAVCGFKPKDATPKWANAAVKNGMVTDIAEKNPNFARNHPALIGTFYFDSARLFLTYAEYILNNNIRSANGEFYMSQLPATYAQLRYPVFFHEVTNVVPLGTPEDLETASQS